MTAGMRCSICGTPYVGREQEHDDLVDAVAERVIEEIVRRLRIISATSEGTWPFVGEYTTTTFYDTESDQRSGLVEDLP